jgi:hypothetical protein
MDRYMTMHLTHFTTTGKRKAKFKYASAEHKRAAEQLAQDWQELKKSYSSPPVARPIQNARSLGKSLPKIPVRGGTLLSAPSMSTGIGVAVKAPVPMYTGDKMIGIGTLHKSNAVPVFSDEEAHDISKMRRG